jgi:hypothetical protein
MSPDSDGLANIGVASTGEDTEAVIVVVLVVVVVVLGLIVGAGGVVEVGLETLPQVPLIH